MLIFGYRLHFGSINVVWLLTLPRLMTSLGKEGSAARLTVTAPLRGAIPGLRLLLGYRNYYTTHESLYMSAHVVIENTLVQHKMAKNSRMALCCLN